MASSPHLLSILFLLFLSSFCVSPILGTSVTAAAHRVEGGIIPIEKIKNALSNANFFTMSLTLDMALNTTIPSEFFNSNDKTITIFCPLDRAFMSPGFKYAGPPLTLLRYHVALGKFDREALDSPKLHWSKVETLLTGHALVVTSVNGRASINGVSITHWNLYNDGHVIVHGVEEFFDPAFQTIWFPQYDGGVPININDESVTVGSRNVVDFLLKLIE